MTEDETKRRLGRRVLALRIAAVGGAVAGIAATEPASAQGITDRDPSDGPGRGRGTGITDRDPSDGPGRGRGTGTPRASGITDRDPSDGPGRGRQTGVTDADPNDGPGRGRGRR